MENSIVNKVIAAATAGFPIITKQQFLVKVGSVVNKLGLKTKDCVPGKDYWLQLKKRRQDIIIRTPENCGSNRLAMMSREVVAKYFDDLESIINELGLAANPSQLWNCDETGLQFSTNAAKVLAPKGVKSLVARCSPSKESITMLVCVNAAGQAMPPMCAVKGKTLRSIYSFATQDAPKGTVWAFQENGWMNDNIGVQWFEEVFLPNCGAARPQILILDLHHSHEVLEMLELARAQNIRILALPPHTTHILQPLDRVVFKPFKTAYRRFCTEFLASNPAKMINKVTWPSILSKTWSATMTEDLIIKSFEATGIHPVNRNRVPDAAFTPGEAYRAATSATAPINISSAITIIVSIIFNNSNAIGLINPSILNAIHFINFNISIAIAACINSSIPNADNNGLGG